MKKIITEQLLAQYSEYLYQEEKSRATIAKYVSDLRKLMAFMDGKEITKEKMIRYKEYLMKEKEYKSSSINSYLVAANRFFHYMNWYGLNVRTIKVQKSVFVPEEKELTQKEFKKLVRTAQKQGKTKIAMILQTICGTGMRVSEVQYVTVTAVEKGQITIFNKGKERTILIQRSLQTRLQGYIRKHHIRSGKVFCTASGKALDRSYIWREMKKLCGQAGVKDSKVFPHNLRSLFARTYYNMFKDIAKLADILGHSSIETTRIYIKSSVAKYRMQLEKLNLLDDLVLLE